MGDKYNKLLVGEAHGGFEDELRIYDLMNQKQ